MVEFDLGKMEKKDLHTVWKHEERDFSRWLSKGENLALLSDALDLDLQFEGKEVPVGGFSVDLLVPDANTGYKVIIENQLGVTNHDHLGKIITYAAGKEANILIWIVGKARDEHRQAVKWLNDKTDSEVGVFLIEMELWSIDGSKPAPKFNVVERPNSYAKEQKYEENLNITQKQQLDFWKGFREYASKKPEFSYYFTFQKVTPKYWYNLSIGSSDAHIRLTFSVQNKEISVGVYIRNNKSLAQAFEKQQSVLKNVIGGEFSRNEGAKDIVFATFRKIDCDDTKKWEDYFQWFCEAALKLRGYFKDFLGNLSKEE